jgi:hypothetical protein
VEGFNITKRFWADVDEHYQTVSKIRKIYITQKQIHIFEDLPLKGFLISMNERGR